MKSPDEAYIGSDEQQIPSHPSLQGPLGFCGTSLSLSQQLHGAQKSGTALGKRHFTSLSYAESGMAVDV